MVFLKIKRNNKSKNLIGKDMHDKKIVSELSSLKDLSINGPRLKPKTVNYDTLSMSTPINHFEMA